MSQDGNGRQHFEGDRGCRWNGSIAVKHLKVSRIIIGCHGMFSVSVRVEFCGRVMVMGSDLGHPWIFAGNLRHT